MKKRRRQFWKKKAKKKKTNGKKIWGKLKLKFQPIQY